MESGFQKNRGTARCVRSVRSEREGGMKNQQRTRRVPLITEGVQTQQRGVLCALAKPGGPSRKRREGRVSGSAADGLRAGVTAEAGSPGREPPAINEHGHHRAQGLGDQRLSRTRQHH